MTPMVGQGCEVDAGAACSPRTLPRTSRSAGTRLQQSAQSRLRPIEGYVVDRPTRAVYDNSVNQAAKAVLETRNCTQGRRTEARHPASRRGGDASASFKGKM